MSPGPTPVPNFALAAMADSVRYHRGPAFSEIMSRCRELLPPLFGTKQEVLIFSGSGTLAMEGAISNFFNPGEEVIAVNSGKFGARWADQARVYGLKVHEIYVERGKTVDLAEIEKLMSPNIRGLLIHASETSTGARHDVKGASEIAHRQPNCLVAVDAVTALAVYSVPTDEWGIDIIVGGSQKGFMLPPGLSFGSCSPRAWEKAQSVKNVRYYMDWRKERKAAEKNTGAFTSPVTLIGGLRSVLEYFNKVGVDSIYQKNWKLCFASRAALKKMGATLLVENDIHVSPACTAFMIDEKFNAKAFPSIYSMTLAGGQDELKGKIVRVGHLGYMDAWDVLNQLIAIGRLFEKAGRKIDFGAVVETYMAIVESEEDFTPADLK